MATDVEILATIKKALAANPGITEIQVDGLRVKADWSMVEKYERKVAEAAGDRPFCASMDLSDFP